MKKIFSSILLAVCTVGIISVVTNVKPAYASPAMPSHNECISRGQQNLVWLAIMGARIEKEEPALEEQGVTLLKRYGLVYPEVDKLNIFVTGVNDRAANASICIRAFNKTGQHGLEMETTSRAIKCLDKEKVNLSYVFSLPAKAKSLMVELRYDTSSTDGEAYNYVSRYYLEII